MKRRDNQLRLRRFRVDELQRRLGTLETIEADLVRKLAGLEETVARERQRANDTDLGRLAFPSFLKAMDSRRENLKATLNEIERERSQTRTELAVAGQELKSFEITTEQEARRAAELPLQRNRIRLGDIALARQLRKQALRQI
jgi:F0F1-type ATP synthase membrane subunit b/b'